MGLFIAAQIVASDGGQLNVRSSEDAGTRFWVAIPV
ncbi:hypothetical protein [Pseudomonas sp. JR33AA]